MTEQPFTTADEQPIAAGLPTTVIQPSRGWAPAKLKDLVQFRELLYFLVWSQLKVRYKQTLLGAGWAIIQPVAIMVVFTVFFNVVARFDTGNIPYPIFTLSGLIMWTYFSGSLNQSSNSLINYENLITKVYFPRLLIPMASVLAGLVDFAIAFALLIVLAIIFYAGFVPTIAILTLPLFVALAVVTALAVSLWLSALNVQYRDVRLLISVMIQLWFFATPIIYPSSELSELPDSWITVYHLINPMVGVVEGIRWALFSGGAQASIVPPPSLTLVVTVPAVLAVLVGGLFYFRRMERIFADVV